MQGIVGTMPWVAMVFFTLWLQLLGFTDLQASLLVAVFGSACSVGGVIGGNIGSPASLAIFMATKILHVCPLPVECVLTYLSDTWVRNRAMCFANG